MKKVAIIDDEAAARQMLRQYLEGYPDFIVIGEANNGVDAIRLIEEFNPELVFLDIQMPGLTGFEVLSRLKVKPNIIFSTAYDNYALEAFEVNAVDYLLKPYTKERFAVAINKVIEAGESNLQELERLSQHLQQQAASTVRNTILVQKGQKYVTINTEDIIWISAEKDYSSIVTASGKYLSSFGISAMEERLDGQQFMRVHRSSIININHIAEVFRNPSSYDILMSNQDKVRVSRSYLDQIRKITF